MEGESGSGTAGAVRVAAIDIGSNAIRYTAAEQRPGGGLVELDYERAAVRLGHSTFLTGRLTEENVEAAVRAMTGFRRRMDRRGVTRYRAVATSAVRDAENGPALVARARQEADIEIDVIDGQEEARLVWLAVRDRLDVEGRWLLVDLGGGSMEVSTTRDGRLESSSTFPVGTVRLLEREGAGGVSGESAVEGALSVLEAGISIPAPEEIRGMLATGGNIEALAELAGARPDTTGASRLSLIRLSRVMERVESLSYDQRIQELGLRPDRADVIVPAGRLYRRVAELAGVSEIVVPNVGVSRGVLLELV